LGELRQLQHEKQEANEIQFVLPAFFLCARVSSASAEASDQPTANPGWVLRSGGTRPDWRAIGCLQWSEFSRVLLQCDMILTAAQAFGSCACASRPVRVAARSGRASADCMCATAPGLRRWCRRGVGTGAIFGGGDAETLCAGGVLRRCPCMIPIAGDDRRCCPCMIPITGG